MQSVKKGPSLSTVLDARGNECSGEKAREAVRDAYSTLGKEDLLDDKFNQMFARQGVRDERRMSAERIQQEELDTKFSLKEVQNTLKRLKAGKAAGHDEILVEWLKYGGDQMTYALWMLCNLVWVSEKCPQEWSKGVITLLYKDGDKRHPLNYRGITLLSVVGKVFAALINKRLMGYCEEKHVLAEEQAGFRYGRACVDQIFILADIISTRRQAGKKTYTCFIDVEKAYDRVWRNGLWMSLWKRGVRGRLWRVFKDYYNKVESCVRLDDGNTEWFDINVGVRQGCVLSPILFDVFIDQLARDVKALGLGVEMEDGGENLSLLMYADDIVLVAESEEDLQLMMNAVARYCTHWRLQVNLGKTKTMVFGERGVGKCNIMWHGTVLQEVTEYKYLGLLFEKNGWKKEKAKMLRKAKKAAAMAWGLAVRVGNMTVKGMNNMWSALVRPHLEYGAEVMNTCQDNKWAEADMLMRKVGRRILKCGSRVPNDAITGELGWMSMRGRRMMLRLSYWGKILAMPDERLVKRVYEGGRALLSADAHASTWCNLTRSWLVELGLQDEWDAQKVGAGWKEKVRCKVMELEQRKWRSRMEESTKLKEYRKWKTEIDGTKQYMYLEERDERRRRLWTKLRTGCLELREETGRWERMSVMGKQQRVPRHARICTLCFREVEDAHHTLF